MINKYICNDFYYFNLIFCVEFVYDKIDIDLISLEESIELEVFNE